MELALITCSAAAGALEMAIQEESKMKKTVFLCGVLSLGLMVVVSGASRSMQTSGNTATARRLTAQSKLTSTLADDPTPVETRLSELFGFCKDGNIETAASYFVYRGEDKARKWKDTLRADSPEERAATRDICRRIKGYLDESQGYSFGAVKVQKESEGEWHALEVFFEQGEKRKKVIFAFLLINGQFAIGDIDSL